ncbi:methyltransferase-like 26 [Leptopilina heterotoma]|uniref:methyltransferase-like 26 n=1 Tax=Leptopilina heterotoma TaxID=63436 RepID=UPI001CA7EAB0|nr:methyltransferase-like 26 [Leptopilina heterotoma]XP_043467140.1 methyltransferase-like 26 [Leptopilina heterotoma]
MWSGKEIYAAAERNKDPILSVLRNYIKKGVAQVFLEIASGSGQHVAHFAPNFPNVTFYPSENGDPKLIRSIEAHTAEMSNVKTPTNIDIATNYKTWNNGFFKESTIDYMYTSNLTHVSPFECTISLFKNAGKLLNSDGLLFMYGPFAVDGNLSPESNINFDKSLRAQNSELGIRDTRDLQELADKNGLQLLEMKDMPANNKTLIWKKSSQ